MSALFTPNIGISRYFRFVQERNQDLYPQLDQAKQVAKTDKEAAQSQLNELIFAAQELNDTKLEEDCLNALAVTLLRWGDAKDALTEFMRVIEFAKERNDGKRISATHNNMGIAYANLGRHQQAMEHYFEAIQLNEQLGDERAKSSALLNMGVCAYRLEDYDEAEDLYNRSLEIAKKIGDRKLQADGYQNQAEVLMERAAFDDARVYLEKSLKLYEKIGNQLGSLRTLNGLGNLEKTKINYPQATRHLSKALTIAREINYELAEAGILSNLGECHVQTELTLRAEQAFIEAMVIAENLQDKKLQAQLNLQLSAIKEEQANHIEALSYFKKHAAIREELKNIQNLRAIGDLELKLDAERKQKEIELEKLKSNELKQALEELDKQKKRSDDLLLNILPEHIADELKSDGKTTPRHYESVSVLFADFVGFTSLAENMPAEELVEHLHHLFASFDRIQNKHGVEKIKTIGDAYMALAGLTDSTEQHAIHAAHAALEMKAAVEAYDDERFQLRIGLHCGAVVAGVVGETKFQYDVWGDTVNIASRIETASKPGKINISGQMYEQLKGQFNCSSRGEIQVKNKGLLHMYFLESVKV